MSPEKRHWSYRNLEIDGDPGGGYRLSKIPDRLYAEEIQTGLDTSWLATEIHYFESVDSTNRVALDLARSIGAVISDTITMIETCSTRRSGNSKTYLQPGSRPATGRL